MFLGSTFLGMTIGGWVLLIVMISFMGTAYFIYLWAKKDGQFDDVEGIKYRMLHEEIDDQLDVRHDE